MAENFAARAEIDTITIAPSRLSDAEFVGLLSRGYRAASLIRHVTPEDSVMSYKSIRRHFLWMLNAVWKSFTVCGLRKSGVSIAATEI